jgi:hypothetical protein
MVTKYQQEESATYIFKSAMPFANLSAFYLFYVTHMQLLLEYVQLCIQVDCNVF